MTKASDTSSEAQGSKHDEDVTVTDYASSSHCAVALLEEDIQTELGQRVDSISFSTARSSLPALSVVASETFPLIQLKRETSTADMSNSEETLLEAQVTQEEMPDKMSVLPILSTLSHPSSLREVSVESTSNDAIANVAGIGQDKRQSPVQRLRRKSQRVSYIDIYEEEDGLFNRTRPADDESDSDVYNAPASTNDSNDEQDIEYSSSDIEVTPSTDEDVLDTIDQDLDNDELNSADEITTQKTAKKKSSQQREGKGIDHSLPPMTNIKDCFADLTAKGVLLGLGGALENLNGNYIKVATMCSGTESPLLALTEISNGRLPSILHPRLTFSAALASSGHTLLHFQHEFSAEIEVFKQGYIERNFQPKHLFRDVRDFIGPSTKAITAYGAEVDIPSNIHILVAGFVCKDLSRLNNKGKSLADGGESGDTWRAVHSYSERFRPSIVLLENVKWEKEKWNDVIRLWDNIGYEANWIYCDTKQYYLPQTRERMYMIAIDRRTYGKGAGQAAHKWQDLMKDLRRQCSSPYEAFLADMPHESSHHVIASTEPDWALCKLRYDHIRSSQKLGLLSPVTRSGGNGTVR